MKPFLLISTGLQPGVPVGEEPSRFNGLATVSGLKPLKRFHQHSPAWGGANAVSKAPGVPPPFAARAVGPTRFPPQTPPQPVSRLQRLLHSLSRQPGASPQAGECRAFSPWHRRSAAGRLEELSSLNHELGFVLLSPASMPLPRRLKTKHRAVLNALEQMPVEAVVALCESVVEAELDRILVRMDKGLARMKRMDADIAVSRQKTQASLARMKGWNL